MRPPRFALPAVALLALTACLSGCGPRQSDAKTGLSVDEQGNLVVIVQDCDGDIDQVRLIHDNAGGSEPVFTRRKPAEGRTAFLLTSGGDGWSGPSVAPPPLRADTEYSIGLGSREGDVFGSPLGFRTRHLEALEPGQVFHRGILPGVELSDSVEAFDEITC